jgi:transcriptional regulator GlxA family with amidase domain
MDRVAEQSGFGSYASLRLHFHRVVGVSPREYRQGYEYRQRHAVG